MQTVMRWLTIIASVLLLGGLTSPAIGDGGGPPATPCPGLWQQTPAGWLCVTVTDPGNPGGGNPGGGNPGGGNPSDGGGPQVCVLAATGQHIPCYDNGFWFGSKQCYAASMAPQPGPSAPEWGSNDPTKGQLWKCIHEPVPAGNLGLTFFVPGNQVQQVVDPGVLAQRALGQMHLAAPEIHMAPQPPLKTYVGLATWLWMPQSQWATLTLPVSAGQTTVTVTAAPARVDWDLTEGLVPCDSAGRPWVHGMSSDQTTDCSYTFDQVSDAQPNGQFPVTATLTYQVDWTCAGACIAPAGSLGEVPGATGQSAIRVGERQSVVTEGH